MQVRAMTVSEMTKPWNEEERRKVDDTRVFQGLPIANGWRESPFSNVIHVSCSFEGPRSLARIVLRENFRSPSSCGEPLSSSRILRSVTL